MMDITHKWKIADHTDYLFRDYYKLVYHNHDEFWFTCLNLKAGPQCGLCGTLVPKYLLIQISLLQGRSWYNSYIYNPKFPYKVRCIYKNRIPIAYITDDGYYVADTEKKEIKDFWNKVVPKHRRIWQNIL